MSALPIAPLLPAIARSLADTPRLILQAPPGSGKTTGVPPALLECPWLAGRKILLLEPRRLAARAAAQRMAQMRAEPVGACIGYRMRGERKTGPQTRIEVVTEGLFTRWLQADPELGDVGAVLFDEFHERSLDADLGLALALEVQNSLRPDLRLVVMSATLEDRRLSARLDAPVLSAESRAFPVSCEYRAVDSRQGLEAAVCQAVNTALDQHPGHILVFLPGMREIRRCQQTLDASPRAEVEVLAMHGSLPDREQLRALQPSTGRQRKIILASAVAETSLTIDGIGVVVDAGLARRARYDLRHGMNRLETVAASQASSEQRAGRAGRTAAGHCIRLWSESSHSRRPPQADPEIVLADLMPLVLELAAWGVRQADELFWLDPPPAAAWERALTALQVLAAVDGRGRPTAHGRAMIETGLHPRLAHMLLRGRGQSWAYSACWMAALLEDADALRAAQANAGCIDVESLLDSVDRIFKPELRQRLERDALRVARRQQIPRSALQPGAAGLMIALAFPDRVARLRPQSRQRYLLRNGRGAILAGAGDCAGSEFLAIAELADSDSQAEARIRAAARLAETDLRQLFAAEIQHSRRIFWDADSAGVQARAQCHLGALLLDDRPLRDPAPAELESALLDGIRQHGLGCLPWTDALRQWQARVGLMRAAGTGATVPADCSDSGLLDDLEDWLAPWIKGLTRLEHLRQIDLKAALHARLDWAQQQWLREQLPETLTVPSGSSIRLDYCQGPRPILAVRLQEMFGAERTPTLADGRIKVQIHLLSPARRPVQVTSDLSSFWDQGYAQVRKELRGRYPKHAWPEDPRQAQALRGVPRRKA